MRCEGVEVASSPLDGAPEASWFTRREFEAGETELFPKSGNTGRGQGSEENHFLVPQKELRGGGAR